MLGQCLLVNPELETIGLNAGGRHGRGGGAPLALLGGALPARRVLLLVGDERLERPLEVLLLLQVVPVDPAVATAGETRARE